MYLRLFLFSERIFHGKHHNRSVLGDKSGMVSVLGQRLLLELLQLPNSVCPCHSMCDLSYLESVAISCTETGPKAQGHPAVEEKPKDRVQETARL